MSRNDAALPESYRACRLGYGCMRIAGDPDRGRAAVIAAYEAGYRLFDHADIYAGGRCEELFGKVLREVAGMREAICLQTKVGIRPGRYDFSRELLDGPGYAYQVRRSEFDQILFERARSLGVQCLEETKASVISCAAERCDG